jgi:hypothetical protein
VKVIAEKIRGCEIAVSAGPINDIDRAGAVRNAEYLRYTLHRHRYSSKA